MTSIILYVHMYVYIPAVTSLLLSTGEGQSKKSRSTATKGSVS